MNKHKILLSTELQEGEKKTVSIQGKSIMFARVDTEVFAVDDICTHQHCSLGGEGYLDGSNIVCGCHGASFDITSGKVMSLPANTDLKTYTVEEKDGNIYVQL